MLLQSFQEITPIKPENFHCRIAKKIELGNDIGICKLKFKKIKSKNSIKTFYP